MRVSVPGSRPRRSTRRRVGVVLCAAACLALVTGELAAQAPDLAQPEPLPAISIDELLVIESLGEGGRSAIFTDPVEAQRVAGRWQKPVAGDELGAGERRARWRVLAPSEAGVFEDVALRGGYGLARVVAPREGVWLLAARGHRHVLVNGVPRTGDVYDLGITRVPVRLVLGANELLFRGGRGRLEAELEPPPAPVYLEERDPTLPDVVRGEAGDLWAGIIVTNATTQWQKGLTISATSVEGGGLHVDDVPPLPALGLRKVAVRLSSPVAPAGASTDFVVELRRSDEIVGRLTLQVPVVDPGVACRRTFQSAIDGSVQYYAELPPAVSGAGAADPAKRASGFGNGNRPGLVLSLHGASVEAIDQARAYRPKPDLVIVAPTNRRPFGFDWEAWGRLDALEVLELVMRRWNSDPRRTYLTGHSMGGHGTWQIGAHFPDRFAAIAPSAGWRDFWSYGGAREWSATDPVERLFARAAQPSRTLLLLRNLHPLGIYVLHGTSDENVPVEQARFMRDRLAEFHPDHVVHEQEGAGHWWGNECVDWPPLFDFLRQRAQAPPQDVRTIDFTTVSPGVSGRCHWLTVQAQARPLAPSRVRAVIDPQGGTLEIDTENITRLALDLRAFMTPLLPPADDGVEPTATRLASGQALVLTVDGESPLSTLCPDDGRLFLERPGARGTPWRVGSEAAPPWRKGPHRYGPFLEAFRDRMMFVYGTRGSPAETAWAFAKARYDAETFWYRGNGSIDIVPDVEFDPLRAPDRNVILYGHREMNSAWRLVLAGTSAIDVRRGRVRVGGREVVAPDLAVLFCAPRAGSPTALVGVVAGTDLPGLRLTDQLPFFLSGVGYPDWCVLSTAILTEGVAGLRGAGYFDDDWSAGADAEGAWWQP